MAPPSTAVLLLNVLLVMPTSLAAWVEYKAPPLAPDELYSRVELSMMALPAARERLAQTELTIAVGERTIITT